MLPKRTMTLNLTDADMKVLEALVVRKGMSKTAVLRQALRLYMSVIDLQDQGKSAFIDGTIVI